jgi:zinc transport system substrate-binding protein
LAEVPRVVTDIPPVHALVAGVMGDLGVPELLLAPGADEHDFQLRPSQMRAIEEAALIVWIGPELTPWLETASAESPAARLDLLALPATIRQGLAAAEGAEDESHGHGPADPHAWLDPVNARLWAGEIGAQLAAIDPANAATYRANAQEVSKRIAALDASLAARLAPLADRGFVTYHDAYGHFTARYGLSPMGSIADSEAAAPGAAHLAELGDLLASGRVTCLFPEAQHDPALALRLLEGTPTRLGDPLDPVGSSLPPGPGAYEALIEGLALTFTACLED